MKLAGNKTSVNISLGNPKPLVFGEQEKVVKSRDDKTFMIRGFARMTPDNETVSCYIKSVR